MGANKENAGGNVRQRLSHLLVAMLLVSSCASYKVREVTSSDPYKNGVLFYNHVHHYLVITELPPSEKLTRTTTTTTAPQSTTTTKEYKPGTVPGGGGTPPTPPVTKITNTTTPGDKVVKATVRPLGGPRYKFEFMTFPDLDRPSVLEWKPGLGSVSPSITLNPDRTLSALGGTVSNEGVATFTTTVAQAALGLLSGGDEAADAGPIAQEILVVIPGIYRLKADDDGNPRIVMPPVITFGSRPITRPAIRPTSRPVTEEEIIKMPEDEEDLDLDLGELPGMLDESHVHVEYGDFAPDDSEAEHFDTEQEALERLTHIEASTELMQAPDELADAPDARGVTLTRTTHAANGCRQLGFTLSDGEAFYWKDVSDRRGAHPGTWRIIPERENGPEGMSYSPPKMCTSTRPGALVFSHRVTTGRRAFTQYWYYRHSLNEQQGGNRVFTNCSGRPMFLKLGCNDNKHGDNSGYFRSTIRRVPWNCRG